MFVPVPPGRDEGLRRKTMTTAAALYPLAGVQTLGNVNNFVEQADNDTSYVPRIPVGTIGTFVDPWYGGIVAIRLCVPKNTTAIVPGTLATWGAGTNAGFLSNYSYVILPSTANLSKPVAVALQPVALVAGFAQYAWFAISGTARVLATVATAVNTPLFISATAGKAFVTLTAGKQLVNMNPVVAATETIAKVAQTQNGSNIIKVANTDGWFVGGSVSGTGIVTSLITNIDQSGNVTLASNSTATGSVTATQTANDGSSFFPTVQFNSPFAQGNVT
jgi:hypothetical protein